MSLFSRSKNPSWLDSAREFCSARNITIMGWGPYALMVEAKSPERAAEISAQLADLTGVPGTAGAITSTSTTARQVQFALKLLW